MAIANLIYRVHGPVTEKKNQEIVDEFLSLANVNSRSRSLYAIARPSVCLSSVTFVRPTQAVQIFGNISTVFGTLAIR